MQGKVCGRTDPGSAVVEVLVYESAPRLDTPART
jgi:hypothetical protein